MTDQPVRFDDGPTDPLSVDGGASQTLIIEDGVIPLRVHRPMDLARFVLAVAVTAGIVLVAWFASSTSAGLDSDLSSTASLLPGLVVVLLNVVGGIGTLGLPIAASISLVARKRLRQLFDSLLALLVTVVFLTGLSTAISTMKGQ